MRSVSLLKSALILSAVSFLILFFPLQKSGMNVVTKTYQLAAKSFWAGLDPYQLHPQVGDHYLYPPFFAWAYGLFAWIPDPVQHLVWVAFAVLLFWCFFLLFYGWHFSKRFFLGLFIVSMELHGSLLYQQINALMLALVFLAAVFVREKRNGMAVFFLSMATACKLLPLLFFGVFSKSLSCRYLLGAAAALLGFFLLPLYISPQSSPLELYHSYIQLMLHSLEPRDYLDWKNVLERHSLASLAVGGWWVVLLTSVFVCFLQRLRVPLNQKSLSFLMAFVFVSILLLSPKTESPTFVWIVPAYMHFLLYEPENRLKKNLERTFFFLAVFLISLSFNDLWPRGLWDPRESGSISKTIGAVLLWVLLLPQGFSPLDAKKSSRELLPDR